MRASRSYPLTQVGNTLAPRSLHQSTSTENEYDELGQLIRKSVGGTDISGQASLQKIDYRYNIRGWLKSINDVEELKSNTHPTDLFAFKISYNQVENTVGGNIKSLFNGNISETFWKTETDNIKRSYGYQYDNLNRLTNAIYQKENVATNSYNERLTYDLNGNITGLYRTGYQDGLELSNPIEIDNLEYGYASNSNQLQLVHDYSQSTNGFKDGNVNDTDFKYDGYGNLILDRNKGIDEITYNHLNLPTEIDFGDSGIIYYIYNALGVKVAKQVRAPEIQDQTDYLSGFQYKNGELQFFPTAEGYVNVSDGGKFNYVYNYTDHLGNIRVSYTLNPADGQLKILEENHYYPFGLKHSNYNVDKVDFVKDETGFFVILKSVERNKNQYKYNGKEFQDELGLNFYDYGARNYDPASGRWMNIDPLSETSRKFSPYTYCLNNPLRFIDPDGMEADDVIITGDDAKRATKALNKSSSLDIKRDKKTGKLSAKGEAKTDYDKALLSAITDDKINVNLKANSITEIAVDGKKGDITLGAYGGSQKVNGKTEAIQMVNMDQIDKVDEAGIMKSGNIVGHEVIESHIAAKENGGNTRANSQKGNEAYDKAHKEAASLDPTFVHLIETFTVPGGQYLEFENGKTVIIK